MKVYNDKTGLYDQVDEKALMALFDLGKYSVHPVPLKEKPLDPSLNCFIKKASPSSGLKNR